MYSRSRSSQPLARRRQPQRPEGETIKQLIVFDLDGTLAESKSPLDKEMGDLLSKLLEVAQVSVISGGSWKQFETQLLTNLPTGDVLRRLSLLPTCGTKFFRYADKWDELYSEDFAPEQKTKIMDAFKKALDEANFKPGKTWGDLIEDRGSQITFSALGQQAPVEEKKKWDPDFSKRKAIKDKLQPLIPEFAINLGGQTSIDITKPGIDKAYGIRKLRDVLHIPIDDMLFIGDAIFPGGNDYPAKEAGAESICVHDPEETKRVVEAITACLRSVAQPQQ